VCGQRDRDLNQHDPARRAAVATALDTVRRVLAGGLLLWALEVGVANASDHSDPMRFRDTEFRYLGAPSVREIAEEGEEGIIDFEAPAETIHQLVPSVFYGSLFEIESGLQSNFDLDDDQDDDLAIVEPKLNFALSYLPNAQALAYVNFELSKPLYVVEEGESQESKTKLEVTRAYVILGEIIEGLSLQLGRQNFDDDREWLYDEELDAGRLRYALGDLGLELAVGRMNLFDRDLLNSGSKDRINTYILFADYEVTEDVNVAGYVVKRDDRTEEDGSPVFFGLRSLGGTEVFEDEIAYWLDLSTVRGDDNGSDIRGYGLDLGATYLFDLPYGPNFTLAYAFGSGDRDPDDGTDKDFRQTGLQGNAGEFGGIASFQYYGEAFDPELSNLHVFTAGLGLRPTEDSSIDLVFHAYRQDEISDELRDSAIDLDPNQDESRQSRRLGSEIDLVIGYHDLLPDLDLEFTFAYFFSGRAFRVEVDDGVFKDADDAFFAGFDMEFSF
jgi:alginate production protein